MLCEATWSPGDDEDFALHSDSSTEHRCNSDHAPGSSTHRCECGAVAVVVKAMTAAEFVRKLDARS